VPDRRLCKGRRLPWSQSACAGSGLSDTAPAAGCSRPPPEQLHSWGWVRVIRRSQRGALSGKHGAIRGYHRALSEECGVIRKWNKEPSFEPGVIHVRGGAISIEYGAI